MIATKFSLARGGMRAADQHGLARRFNVALGDPMLKARLAELSAEPMAMRPSTKPRSGARSSGSRASRRNEPQSFKTGFRVCVPLVCGELIEARGLAVVLRQAATGPRLLSGPARATATRRSCHKSIFSQIRANAGVARLVLLSQLAAFDFC